MGVVWTASDEWGSFGNGSHNAVAKDLADF